MLLEPGFQGVVNVRVNASDDPYKLVISSTDDIESIIHRFFEDSPFPQHDQHKLREMLKDVQLEVCKMELAFVKRVHAAEKQSVPMDHGLDFDADVDLSRNGQRLRLPLETAEEFVEEVGDKGLRLKIDVPHTHEASLRFSGRSELVSHNEAKLQEHLKEERRISLGRGLPLNAQVSNANQARAQSQIQTQIETKEVEEEIHELDRFGGGKTAAVIGDSSDFGQVIVKRMN